MQIFSAFFFLLAFFSCLTCTPNENPVKSDLLSEKSTTLSRLDQDNKTVGPIEVLEIEESDEKKQSILVASNKKIVDQNPSAESAKIGKDKKSQTKIKKSKEEDLPKVFKKKTPVKAVDIEDPSTKESEATDHKAEQKESINQTKDIEGKTNWDAPPSHEKWDNLLKEFVSNSGKVNYKGIKAVEGKLDDYLQILTENPVQTNWSKNEKMAYWINAYNAFTVKLIVKNYPVSSIMKLHNGKPWDVKWIQLGNKTYSLNEIEHRILRPKYKDARIHFAVNCAAKSCPPLLNRAWKAENLNRYF